MAAIAVNLTQTNNQQNINEHSVAQKKLFLTQQHFKIALIVHSKYSCLFTMLLPVVENINIINSNIRKPVFPN